VGSKEEKKVLDWESLPKGKERKEDNLKLFSAPRCTCQVKRVGKNRSPIREEKEWPETETQSDARQERDEPRTGNF